KKTQLEFWTGFMEFLSNRGSKIRLTAPRPQHWASFSIGRSNFRLDAYALVRDGNIGVNLILSGESAKGHFYALQREKEKIDTEIAFSLQWGELPQYKGSQVYTGPHPVDFSHRGRWPEYYAWLVDMLEAYYRVFAPRIRVLRPE